MLSERDLLARNMQLRANLNALNEVVDEVMNQTEFQDWFRGIPESWLRLALQAYAKKVNNEAKITEPPQNPGEGIISSAFFDYILTKISFFKQPLLRSPLRAFRSKIFP